MPTSSDDAFLHACGAAGPVRLRLEHASSSESKQITLGRPYAIIGSSSSADVVLDHPDIARRHAYLQVIGGQVFWLIVSSPVLSVSAGTGPCGWLDVGRPLEIGPFRLSLADSAALALPNPHRPAPLAPGSAVHLPVPSATLEFLKGERVTSRWEMDRQLALMGRWPLCKVRLHSNTVSRVHCSLLLTPHGPWVVDLMGAKGVRIGSQRARFGRLEDGDVLELGEFRIRCRYKGEPTAGASLVPVANHSGGALLPGPDPLATLFGVPALPPNFGENDPGLRSLVLALVQQFNQMQSQMFDQFQQAVMQVFQIHNERIGTLSDELDRARQLTDELRTLRQAPARTPSPAPPPGATRRENGTAAPGPTRPARAPAQPPPKAPNSPSPVDGAPTDSADLHAWLCERVAALQQERQGRWSALMQFMTGKKEG